MNTYLIKTLHGLEQVLADELKPLGAQSIEILTRAVKCSGDQELAYRVNYLSRTALSVLQPMVTGTVENEQDLYDFVYEIDWYHHFTIEKTFLIDVVCFSETFRNTLYVAQKSKDAVADKFRSKYNKRPSVRKDSDLRINIYIRDNECTISRDLTGKPLFHRGYRIFKGEAPINEVLASGLLKLTGWTPPQPLVDPMCGSGTFLIEAASQALNRPPQFLRTDFALMHYLDFNRRSWQRIRDEADQQDLHPDLSLLGMDLDGQVVRMARKNTVGIDLQMIEWKKKDFFSWDPDRETGCLIFNPPYDERLELDDAIDFYRKIGDHLKHHFAGWQAWIISSHLKALKHIGLKPKRKHVVYNGPLECRFLGFNLY
ncbi:MAG: class I SAM-dependent RNA methyltransferase [Saprospiraceae bacterium]|nr:class I SAM-dependent RNA methyltransferase [Saprospiraceae bacterium]